MASRLQKFNTALEKNSVKQQKEWLMRFQWVPLCTCSNLLRS